MIIKTIIAALIAGVVYTILMGLNFKKKGVSSSRKYVSGISFTVVLFFCTLYTKSLLDSKGMDNIQHIHCR